MSLEELAIVDRNSRFNRRAHIAAQRFFGLRDELGSAYGQIPASDPGLAARSDAWSVVLGSDRVPLSDTIQHELDVIDREVEAFFGS